jgi:hypothetical protein
MDGVVVMSQTSPVTETPTDILERLRKQANDVADWHGQTMKEWDKIRATVEAYKGSDLPRLMFEGLVESLAELMHEGANEIEKQRRNVHHWREECGKRARPRGHAQCPTREAVEKALCCPKGCVRSDDCFVNGPPVRWSRSKHEREQADAILALCSVSPAAAPTQTPTASNVEATVSRIMRIRNGMIMDGDAEALIRKEIGALMGSHAQRPKEPVAWRYQGRVGWGDVWRLSEIDPTKTEGFFESPEGWVVQPLFASPDTSTDRTSK